MKLQIKDKDSNILDLDGMVIADGLYHLPEMPSIDVETSIIQRYGQDGGVEVGDGRIKQRKIGIQATFTAKTDILFRKLCNDVAVFFRASQRPFRLYDLDNSLSCVVSYGGLKTKYSTGMQMRLAEGTFELEMLDACFESDVITDTNIFSDNEVYTININDVVNSIKAYNAYPIITVTPSGNLFDFFLKNTSNGLSMRLQELSFTTGNIMKIDCESGYVFLNNTIKNRIMTAGTFLRFDTGNNDILFQGANNATIDFEFRKRFLF